MKNQSANLLNSVATNYAITRVAITIPNFLSAFFAVIDHRSDLRAEFFLHPANDGILLGPAASTGPRSQLREIVASFPERSLRESL